MELELKTVFKDDEYTIGKLYIDGEYFCDTLEDTVREIKPDGTGKIKGMTAIPAGKYKVILNMSPRFKRILPRLLNVPHFEGVLIHRGNSAKDTDGCILVGKNTKKGFVLESAKYEIALIARLQDAVKLGEEITIEIKR